LELEAEGSNFSEEGLHLGKGSFFKNDWKEFLLKK
jgi:hypothetical protein